MQKSEGRVVPTVKHTGGKDDLCPRQKEGSLNEVVASQFSVKGRMRPGGGRGMLGGLDQGWKIDSLYPGHLWMA